MTIITVEFRKLISTGDFSNTTVGATAVVELDAGETAEAALDGVRTWVQEHLDQDVHAAEALPRKRSELWSIDQDISIKRRQLQDMQEAWTNARTLLEKHGVQVEPSVLDIPF